MHRNKFLVAAAGSGKTTYLICEALKPIVTKALITTYTQANEAEIRKRLVEVNGCIPENISVQTWFSFLLQHCVKPFQGCLCEEDINGILLVNSQSALKCQVRGRPLYYSEEKEFRQHYFTPRMKIYTDKISKFAFKCNQKTNGSVIDRLSRIYSHIFIDEVQDLAGYDLELLNLILESDATIQLVGDPRQGTYSTNSAPKNKKFRKSEIVRFFSPRVKNILIDSTSLNVNHRCVDGICQLSNKLYPDLDPTVTGNHKQTGHDGVFIVKHIDVDHYLEQYNPIQLRDNQKKQVRDGYPVMNFGESKGLQFERVLIYATAPFTEWLKNSEKDLAPTSRSKFYVAMTRAKQSVGIVCDLDCKELDGIYAFS